MLTQEQVRKIKEHLDKAQNPLFFFDNDTDGLCSFLLLQRYIGRGKGVPVKSFPDLSGDYFRKVEELNADYIFILDKPVVSKEFFEKVRQVNIPVIWIDHHNIDKEAIPKFVDYYNPLFNENKSNEPVSALCYQINDRKNDLWIAVAGSISDRFIPDFYYEFKKNYPDLAIGSDFEEPFEILYNSGIGKITKIFNFALKDRTSNVINMLKFLVKLKTPYEVLEENSKNHSMHLRFKQVNSKYQKLLKKAISNISDVENNFLFFQFGGDLSIVGELSNELSYKFPDKVIVVAYIKGTKANISIRGKKIRDKVLEAIKGFEDATGGGHEDAVGAKIKIEDMGEFRERLEKILCSK